MRSRRYRCLDAQPAIRARTDFFAAAAIVTRVLAYSGATPFMAALSNTLESVNVHRAKLICSGQLYATGSIECNTRDFVCYEQVLVQEALDRLRWTDPHAYAEQVRIANGALARVLRPRAACASGALAAFVCAAECCLVIIGRAIEFSAQSDRETLGEELARSARRIRARELRAEEWPAPRRRRGVAVGRAWPGC